MIQSHIYSKTTIWEYLFKYASAFVYILKYKYLKNQMYDDVFLSSYFILKWPDKFKAVTPRFEVLISFYLSYREDFSRKLIN